MRASPLFQKSPLDTAWVSFTHFWSRPPTLSHHPYCGWTSCSEPLPPRIRTYDVLGMKNRFLDHQALVRGPERGICCKVTCFLSRPDLATLFKTRKMDVQRATLKWDQTAKFKSLARSNDTLLNCTVTSPKHRFAFFYGSFCSIVTPFHFN